MVVNLKPTTTSYAYYLHQEVSRYIYTHIDTFSFYMSEWDEDVLKQKFSGPQTGNVVAEKKRGPRNDCY